MNTLSEFLWGTPDEVAARVRADVPSFRLVNPSGALSPATCPFTLPTGGSQLAATATPMAAPHAGGSRLSRPLVRADRRVGTVWEDDNAVYCCLAGVLPPDLSAPRGAQAAAIFPEMESLLAEAGMTFANVTPATTGSASTSEKITAACAPRQAARSGGSTPAREQ